MLQIRCVNNHITKSFPEGASLLDVYESFKNDLDLKFPVVSARVNNTSQGLKFRLFQNRDVEFLDASTGSGFRAYVRSLCFVLYKATSDLFPGSKLFIEHPLSNGYYCNFRKKKHEEPLTEEDVEQIKKRIQEIIDSDMPFRRMEATTEETIRVFAERGFSDKVKLLETSGQIYSDYYILGDTVDYFYGPLVPSTEFLDVFDVVKYYDGILLQLPRSDGKLDVTRMSALVDQIAWLRKQDIEVILVSSGAMASGRGELRVDHSLDSVEQRQLFSAVGQVKLVGLYYDLFREFGIHVGQVLTMKENFQPGEQYRNQRACMTVMLENDVLPIVNENDTVSVTELMFTDNDELSGLIAQMMEADTLILLSNIDGIYDGHPDNPSSRIIPTVEPGRDLSQYIKEEKSAFGRGGMHSKYTTASKVSQAGIRVIIANGERENILIDLIGRKDETPHTEFIPCN